MRRHDLRPLQEALIPWGLSSLGRSESRVLANLDAVIAMLGAVVTGDLPRVERRPPLRAFSRGRHLLVRHAAAALGPAPGRRRVRILVTLPDEAATDACLLRELVARGMDCARINCAHGDPDRWEKMIGHYRQAAAELGRTSRVLMDLGGPKPRTGSALAPDEARLRHGEGDRSARREVQRGGGW